MKPYKLADKEIVELISKTGWGLKRAESLNLNSNYITVAHAAQKKLLEYLDNLVLYTADDEIGTGEDCNIMLCITPEMWRNLLKNFGLEFHRKEV